MLIVIVNVQVVEAAVQAFVSATLENARASLLESGIVRFDVIQREDDPTRFALIEVYRDAGAPAAHKATAHYAKWRETVEPMMAAPRTSQKYVNLAPPDAGWSMPPLPKAPGAS
jgi:(4S)-4-hydroxy-5-phosphonooxypentane-2,3-dione isomerase